MDPRTPGPRQWWPRFDGDRRLGRHQPPGSRSWERRRQAMPRRGPPVAAIRVPRWYPQEEMCWRQPRGVKPRGTLRGGPARSARDPQRKPPGGLCGGPARSAEETQTRHKKTSQQKASVGGTRKAQDGEGRPAIVTVDQKGRETRWGPVSRRTAWRAGCYFEDMDGEVKVFL